MPMRVFAVSQPLAEIVRQLNDWQPAMLSSCASTIHILADGQLGGRLHIHPHWIVPNTEVLTEEIRRCIEAGWGGAPFNAYWTAAGGNLASERTDHMGLYLFEDNLIFEVVDDKVRFLPADAYSAKLLITVLSSWTQPLIRFELNDRVRLAADTHNSAMHFARIDGIQRRTQDILPWPGTSSG